MWQGSRHITPGWRAFCEPHVDVVFSEVIPVIMRMAGPRSCVVEVLRLYFVGKANMSRRGSIFSYVHQDPDPVQVWPAGNPPTSILVRDCRDAIYIEQTVPFFVDKGIVV